MSTDELKIKIADLLPAAVFDETGEWLNVFVQPADWPAFAKHLYFDESLHFDFLFCVTCVDFKTNFTMLYHLTSTKYRHTVVVKSLLDYSNPSIETVTDIWHTANFHEREVYEMFGINFINHPDLRLLILPDGWEGKNPMRKDFEDEVNMIRL